MPKTKIPTYDTLLNPVIQALKELGGSGTIEEVNLKTTEIANLSEDQLEVLHDKVKSSQTEVEYRLAWARTYLKKYGILENSTRGVWALTQNGRKVEQVNEKEVVDFVRGQLKSSKKSSTDTDHEEIDLEMSWRDELLQTLLQMDASAFERLIQRVLRESGFIQVEVTGQSGDGGIDGKGIMRLGGLLSFHVIFQCKRYRGTVTPNQIRDFRGAMVGRADKGLFITTGNFTKEATREATRDGAPAIDLIDGEQLIEKLKDLGLGVKIEKVEEEKIIVDADWILSI
ncbi:MAG: restriction endonuclease [candidate division KSB1 bacterium]|jgi:restriction system protein|nr:restriction endonuclease [candidate division KSB1 bacterium]